MIQICFQDRLQTNNEKGTPGKLNKVRRSCLVLSCFPLALSRCISEGGDRAEAASRVQRGARGVERGRACAGNAQFLSHVFI